MNRENYEDDDDDSDNYNDDNNKKNEIIARYEINEDSKKIKIFGNEFIKNNKNNFEFFVNGELRIIRDEIDKSFWKKNDKIIEIKLLEKKKCTSMKSMFYGADSLISITEQSQWNTKYVTDMSFMFDGCRKLKDLPDISNWNTKKVKDMSYMFRECLSLENIKNLDKLKTNKVMNLSFMFCPREWSTISPGKALRRQNL